MNTFLRWTIALLLIPAVCAGDESLQGQAEASLRKGVAFFHSLNVKGGYGYYVTPDLKRRWGEGPLDANTIEVQPPGTPAVGQSFLRAYLATGDGEAFEAAKDAANALIRGQNEHGGWDHTINFAKPSDTVSFDDNQSQSAVRFLMALDHEIDNETIAAGTRRAIEMMMRSQFEIGGWPHKHPKQGNYHDYATYNDAGINDCIRVMMDAHRYYPHDEAIERSLRKAARFVVISQLPPPQPGWAQQYNEFLQPAWARSFEPPAVCPSVTIKNINSLIDLYLLLGDKKLLEPIPDSLRWLKEIQLENGKWARFVELGTNKPLYYDRERIRVNRLEDLHVERRTGYAYETNLQSQLKATDERFRVAFDRGRRELQMAESPALSKEQIARKLDKLSQQVREVIETQETSGAWITRSDRFKQRMPNGVRWHGQYEVADRISSSTFNRNIGTLCEYIELCKSESK